MNLSPNSLSKTSERILSTNKVLKNTYLLLSATLLFSALMAGIAMINQVQLVNPLLFIVGYVAILFLVHATSQSAWGIASVFLLTGFMGYTLGPILNFYIQSFSNGGQIVMTALGATGFIFLALSFYAVSTQKDFSYLGGLLIAALLAVTIAMIASLFLPVSQVLISAAFVLIASGLILFQTSLIVNGGETNYILATVSLYISIYNLFISLLRVLSAFAGNNRN